MSEIKIDLSKYHNALSRKHQLIRLVWNVVWTLFARPLPQRTVCFNESFLNPKDVEKPDWIYID